MSEEDDADVDVAVEADTVGCDAEGGRLANIVQERAPGEGEWAAGWKLSQEQKRVHPDVSLGVKLGRLRNALHARDLG